MIRSLLTYYKYFVECRFMQSQLFIESFQRKMKFFAIFSIVLLYTSREIRGDTNLEELTNLLEAVQNGISHLARSQTALQDKIDGLEAKQDVLLSRIDQMETKLTNHLFTQDQNVEIQHSKSNDKMTSLNSTVIQNKAFLSNRMEVIEAYLFAMDSKLQLVNSSILEHLEGVENTMKAKNDDFSAKQDTVLLKIEQIEIKILDLVSTQQQHTDKQTSKIDQSIKSVQETIIHLWNKTETIGTNLATINSNVDEKLDRFNEDCLIQLLYLQRFLNTSIVSKLENIMDHTVALQHSLNSRTRQECNETTELTVEDVVPRRNYTTGGCGEIIIKDFGTITFEQDFVGDLICVWTVRVDKRLSAAFWLGSLKGNATVTLTPAASFYSNNYVGDAEFQTSQQIIRTAGPGHTEFVVRGPTVFVTLSGSSTSSSDRIKMKMYFEGKTRNSSLANFYHYHPTTSTGAVSYPKDRGVTNYAPDEFASFVINPRKLDASIYMRLNKLSLEPGVDGCQCDSLSFGRYDKDTARFERVGPSATRPGFCNPHDSLPTTIGSTNSVWIVVFKSDETVQKDGFGFNWVIR